MIRSARRRRLRQPAALAGGRDPQVGNLRIGSGLASSLPPIAPAAGSVPGRWISGCDGVGLNSTQPMPGKYTSGHANALRSVRLVTCRCRACARERIDRVAGRDARRDAERAQHHRHRRRVVVEVAALQVEQEVVDAVATGRRRRHVVVVRERAQVRLDRRRLVVRRRRRRASTSRALRRTRRGRLPGSCEVALRHPRRDSRCPPPAAGRSTRPRRCPSPRSVSPFAQVVGRLQAR